MRNIDNRRVSFKDSLSPDKSRQTKLDEFGFQDPMLNGKQTRITDFIFKLDDKQQVSS
jgi:hypothetical protein